jgi:hypothetical protein
MSVELLPKVSFPVIIFLQSLVSSPMFSGGNIGERGENSLDSTG